MTLLEGLQSHRGGLLRIKGQLFWYGGQGWDGAPGRVCLILDAALHRRRTPAASSCRASPPCAAAAVLLLIDGAPHWIWVGQEDVELIT